MIIDLCDICLINVFLKLWLGLVMFSWLNKNHKPNQIVRLSKKVVQIYPSKLRFFAVWVGSVCGFYIRLVPF